LVKDRGAPSRAVEVSPNHRLTWQNAFRLQTFTVRKLATAGH